MNMNFEQALQALFNGEGVRLSDWLGYWFIADSTSASTDNIRVFTKDGYILDTPDIDRYKDRDDWEVVTQTGWSFDMALRFLKNGKRVRRSGWNGKGMWIQMVGEGTFTKNQESYPSTAYLQIKSVNDTVTPWLASQTDLLANDWEVVS